MSLIGLLAVGAALALEPPAEVWLGPADGGAPVAAGPDRVDAASWFPATGWTLDDDFVLTSLAAELEAVRPLAIEFDGELEIMARLRDAVAQVQVLSGPEDRDLIYRALVFQGFAVHRYFQDTLATDAAAEPYRTLLVGDVVVAPWAAAIALDPERTPAPEDLPEQAQRLAFDALRAQLRVAPPATLTATGLPEGLRLRIDGVVSPDLEAGSARVVPGPHWASAWQSDTLLLRDRIVVGPGDSAPVLESWGPTDQEALRAALLASDGRAVAVPVDLQVHLDALGQPVVLVVPDAPDGPLRWDVVGGAAVPSAERAGSGGGALPAWLQPSSGVGGRVSLGGGWLYDGDYYLLHAGDGAPHTKATVNAVPLTAGVNANAWTGIWAVGAGVDLLVPFGEHQTLPIGENTLRARAYPHVSAGAIFLQVTAGWLFPWQLGLGAVAHAPLGERLSLSLHGLYGKGWTLDRSPDPDFEASDSLSAWLTLDVRAERSRPR